ncbi:MAG: DUF4435 domain-containing protein [bacterium]
MKQYISKHTIANEVRMMRTHHSGAMLIVEGPSDKSFFSGFIHGESCKIVIGHGKENSVGAQEILNGEGCCGVLTIVDADFYHLEGIPVLPRNVIITDMHDVECMMCASPAFNKVLWEFGTEEGMDHFARERGSAIASVLVKSAMNVGYLRWVSSKHSLGLDFDGLTFRKFVDRRTLEVSVQDLVSEVKNHSMAHRLSGEWLVSQIEAARSGRHDPWQVACGHDVLEILSLGLQRTLAARKGTEVARKVLERSLRLAYSSDEFVNTGLYKTMRDWEEGNRGYRVLRG